MDGNIGLPDLMTQLGESGPYQLKQHCLHGLTWALAGIHMMSFVFVFPDVGHRCYVHEVDGYHYADIDTTKELHTHIPISNGKAESCLKYDNYNGTAHSCDQGYVYNYSVFPSSRVTEWDMICDQRWMRALLQSSFLFGCLVGSLVCGYLADKFGCKPVCCVSGVIQLFAGINAVFQQNYYALLFSMFWYGFFGGAACVICAVTLTMELVASSKRSFYGTMFTVWFNLGSIIVVIWAYFLTINAKFLQLIFAMHSVFLLGHYWFMDESICWLWANGRRENALEIVKKAIKINGKEFKNFSKSSCEKHGGHQQSMANCPDAPTRTVETRKARVWDLFQHQKLRRRTLVMLYCWFASALIYFGLSFNSVNLVGNPYLMFTLNILAEIPGHIISIFLTSITGNKLMISMSLFISGSACILASVISAGFISTLIITMMAKVAATVTFNVINSYTTELFPTSLRNTALGMCMMVARAGAAILPQINLLASTAEGEECPTITFGIIGVVASFLTILLLPETMNKEIPQTVEDIEKSERKNILTYCIELI